MTPEKNAVLSTDSPATSHHHSLFLVMLILMALAWIPPGLFGHEPWKPDEGYTIGLVNHMTQTGDWIVPTLAGEPFMEKPPIFFLTASLFAKLLSPNGIPLHQAAALATALYMALLFVFSYLSGKEANGTRGGMICALGLMGCVGLTVRAHSTITDAAMWCGFAIAGYGMLVLSRRNIAGAFWFGTGSGLTFMAKGFQGPAFIGVATLLLPLFCTEKRSLSYCRFLVWSFLFSLPWLLIWPVALYRHSPDLFNEWFWANNIGRFLGERYGYASLTQDSNPWKYVLLFPWFTLPLWPPAILVWWRKGARGLNDSKLMFPTLIVVAGLILLTAASGRRELYMIPLLPPLALIAAQCKDPLPGWLNTIMRRVIIFAAGLGLVVVWGVWIGWRVGWPPALMGKIASFAPGLEDGTGRISLVLAVLYSVLWCILYISRRLAPQTWDWAWAGGMTAVWGVAMLLFMPILNYTNGYKATFADMMKQMPENVSSIRVNNCRLGESQRAILEYYFGLVTHNIEKPENTVDTAEYLLFQMSGGGGLYHPGDGWQSIWEGARPGDKRERYILYKNSRRVNHTLDKNQNVPK